MQSLLSQLRYTIRLLLKSPGFTITAVLILGFGIGANTAIFSLIDSVLLRPLPFPKPDRLVSVFLSYQNVGDSGLDYPDYVDMNAATHSFDSLAVTHSDVLDLSGTGEAERLHVHFVSASLFQVTGRPLILGRSFTEQEDIPHGPLVALLTERFWRTRFNSDPNIIGKSLTLSDQNVQVIGIVSEQVDDAGPPPADAYVPIHALLVFDYPLLKRSEHWIGCLGRLKGGVSVAQARADLETIQNNLVDRYPDADKGYGLRISPLLDSIVGRYSTTVWLLGGAVGCLFLISSANVANLLFARALERRKEMTVRAALGASRTRLFSQLLFEAAFLSLLGGVLGLFVAFGTIGIIKELSPQDLYRFQEVGINANALLFVFAVTAAISLLAGFLPAWNLSKANIGSALKDEGGRMGSTGPQRQRTQSILVIGQVALACLLLSGTGLLARSFQAAQNVPFGFDPHHILIADLNLTSTKYELDGVRTRAFWDAVLEKVRQLPGVTEAAMNDNLPFNFNYESSPLFRILGQPDLEPGLKPRLSFHMVSPDYFRTLRIPLLGGRYFNAQDNVNTQNVVIIDDALAQRYFPGQDPIGKGISVSTSEGEKTFTVVGVVPHVRSNSPDHQETPFQAYFPYSQSDYDFEVLIVRTPGDPAALTTAVRQAVASVDPTVPVPSLSIFDDQIAQKFVTPRLSVLLVSVFSGAALFLSAIGLYGVLAYSVSQRSRDLGIRIALGAQSSDILALVSRQGLHLVGIGVVIGIGSALLLGRLIENVLYGVSATDPISLAISVFILGLAAFVACLLPALRATRINPITALRE